jgi:hypothetical protein
MRILVLWWAFAIVLLIVASGCRKKTPAATAPVPKAPPIEPAKSNPPTISEFTAEPSGIERGQSAQLRWRVKDATEIEINRGIGAVTVSGHRRIAPNHSTTYTLTAKGPGGSATAGAVLTVTIPFTAPVELSSGTSRFPLR